MRRSPEGLPEVLSKGVCRIRDDSPRRAGERQDEQVKRRGLQDGRVMDRRPPAHLEADKKRVGVYPGLQRADQSRGLGQRTQGRKATHLKSHAGLAVAADPVSRKVNVGWWGNNADVRGVNSHDDVRKAALLPKPVCVLVAQVFRTRKEIVQVLPAHSIDDGSCIGYGEKGVRVSKQKALTPQGMTYRTPCIRIVRPLSSRRRTLLQRRGKRCLLRSDTSRCKVWPWLTVRVF